MQNMSKMMRMSGAQGAPWHTCILIVIKQLTVRARSQSGMDSFISCLHANPPNQTRWHGIPSVCQSRGCNLFSPQQQEALHGTCQGICTSLHSPAVHARNCIPQITSGHLPSRWTVQHCGSVIQGSCTNSALLTSAVWGLKLVSCNKNMYQTNTHDQQ